MASSNKNIISVSEDLINTSLRSKVLSSPAGNYISDYHLSFSQGYIFLKLNLNIKTLGPLTANYRLEITDLTFRPGAHILIVDYIEDVSSTGGFAQSMMLKAAGLKGGSFLQNVLAMSNPPGIKADSKSCTIDLRKLLRLNDSLASILTLEYVDARNEQLTLSYNL